MRTLERKDLIGMYDEILKAGLLPKDFISFKASGMFRPGVIVQSSSGSTGKEIFRIPRLLIDIQDIFRRTLIPYLQHFKKAPARIAMLGGVSHMEAAMNFQLKSTTFKSFTLQELSELESFEPDVISCYPSIARELVANQKLRLPSLLAFKFGGEPLLEIDLKKIRARFPGIAIFEQVGSTEMPALAIGIREPGQPRRLPLQKERFSFLLSSGSQWQSLVVKDNFPQLLFPIPDYYDTQDEVMVDGEFLLAVRRRDEKMYSYLPLIENLLEAGACNVQIDLDLKEITVDAENLPKVESCFTMKLGRMQRLTPSNKLPFIKVGARRE